MWQLKDSKLIILINDSHYSPTSSEIIGLQFKDRPIFANGQQISNKPSSEIKEIKFNRFPLAVRLTVYLPGKGRGKPYVRMNAKLNTANVSITDTKYDQLIIDNQWYSLDRDSLDEINELLIKSDISDLSILSLKQCLLVMKSDSDLIDVIHNADPEHIDTDKIKQFNPELINATLYPYQSIGANWIINILNEGIGCILADEMGLGKTLQIIAVLTHFSHKQDVPFLIISPATLLENWKREVNTFAPSLSVYVHSGTGELDFLQNLKNITLLLLHMIQPQEIYIFLI